MIQLLLRQDAKEDLRTPSELFELPSLPSKFRGAKCGEFATVFLSISPYPATDFAPTMSKRRCRICFRSKAIANCCAR